jgi:hypothetical protein
MSMTDHRPCSCGGSNENCVQCFGRGFVEGHSEGKSSAPRMASSARSRGVKCPVCAFKGSTNDFTRHFALAHGTKGRLRRRIQVPVVFVAVSSRSIGVSKVTKKKKKRKKKKNITAANARRFAKENISQQSLRHKGKVEAEAPPWRNNLDATKNYGYPARESGRYGSHPSHDGFDDESKP